MLGVENQKGLKCQIGVKKKVPEGLKLKTLLPHFTPLPDKLFKIRTVIGSDGTDMWVSECGYHALVSECGNQCVGISMWVSECGYQSVGFSVWVFWPFGSHQAYQMFDF